MEHGGSWWNNVKHFLFYFILSVLLRCHLFGDHWNCCGWIALRCSPDCTFKWKGVRGECSLSQLVWLLPLKNAEFGGGEMRKAVVRTLAHLGFSFQQREDAKKQESSVRVRENSAAPLGPNYGPHLVPVMGFSHVGHLSTKESLQAGKVWLWRDWLRCEPGRHCRPPAGPRFDGDDDRESDQQ